MKRILSLLLALCMMFCTALPAFALDIGADGIPTMVGVSGEDTLDSGAPTIGESGGEAAKDTPATPTDAEKPAPEITPFSDFGDGDTTFTTKIRLTVTDRDGHPIAGAVYGLYASDGTFIQELVTDSYGIATSDDIPVDTDYYVEEISAPEGFQPNDGQKEIKLTDVCAPSRIDITAEYDPITGQIKVVKTDEDGNLLSDVGFYVYTYPDWTQVDDITTVADGTATTITLPYGEYAFEEYNIPDGLAADSYYYASIYEQDVTVELEITNYKAMGDVKITKMGNDGRQIAGAVFEIYNADTNDLMQEITTNSSGYVWSAYMPLGNYYAVEKSVPAPYKLDTTRHDFSLTNHYQSHYLNIENVVDGDPGRVKIIKTDDSDNPLSSVVFGLYRSWDGKKLGELTTGADGTVESGDLIPGDYYLLERTGKPGYTPVTGQIAFTIDGMGATVEQTVINPKIRIFGKVKVIKVDDAGNPIPGVKFGVYCDQGNLLEELTTGEDGTATSGVLNEGNYYLQELEGAAGYLTDDAQHPFSITTNESVVPVTVTNPRITGGVKVIKTGTDGEALYGVVFGVYEADTDKEVCRLTTAADGTAESTALYYGNYYLKELETLDGYELIDTPIPFAVSEQSVVLEIPVTNPFIVGGVKITKVSGEEPLAQDGTGLDSENPTPLSGAVFGLYNERGQKMTELVTGEDGCAVYDGLPKGRYYLKELLAPEGFVLRDELIPFVINTQGEIFETTVYNSNGYGTIRVVKTGENGAALSAVTFDVYRTLTDEKVGSLTTEADGTAALELPLGRYYLVETATVPGYALLTGKASFTLTEDGATVELPIMNQKESCKPEGGHIRLLKRDADNSDTLTGAIFGIYHAGSAKYAGEIATGSDGTATSLMLPAGDYYIVELRAPDGYTTDTTQHPVKVTTGGIVEITVTNKKLPETPTKPEPNAKNGTVKIIKVDAADGNKKLAGASFSVYETAGGKKVGELLTGTDGTAALELSEGDYTIHETAAPAGYQLSTESISLHLKAGETRELTVKNSKAEPEQPEKPGTLRIVKEDKDGGKKLKDAVFGVYRSDDDKLVKKITTDRKGIAELELPVDDYYIRELEAPDGYKLKKVDINFHITTGETKELTVKNAKEDSEDETGTLRIIKEDKETGDPLKNATFGIYDSDDDRIDELTTGKDGTAELDLPVGSYYLRELEAPKGYQLDRKKVTFKVTEDKTIKVTVENIKEKEADKTGTLRIVKSAAGTGKRLSGAVFGVYASSGDKRLDELTTDRDGVAVLDLPVGSYYLKEQKAPDGFKLETARILFSITADGKTLVEVTNEKEGSKPTPEQPTTPTNPTTPPTNPTAPTNPEITIPKTGEAFPTLQYALALLCLGAAALCGTALYRQRKKPVNE